MHLEVVLDLTTEAFVAELRWFVARRGTPAVIRSDNGTNFVGAHRLLDAAYEASHLQQPDEALATFLMNHHIEWLHTPGTSVASGRQG